MARVYARTVGVALLALGLFGLVAGEGALFDQVNIEVREDVIHLLNGALLAFIGFALKDDERVRRDVGVLGVVYLLVAIAGFVDAQLFGLLVRGNSTFDNVFHLVLGALGVAAAWLMGDRDEPVAAER